LPVRRHDRLGEGPREDEQVIGLRRVDLGWVSYGYVRRGREQALLERVVVDDEIELVATESKVREQRCGLCRGAVSGDGSSGRLERADDRSQLHSYFIDPLAKPDKCPGSVEPPLVLQIDHLRERR